MKKITAMIVPVLLLAAAAFAGPYDAWTKFRTITVNTAATGGGAGVTSAQTNFPVLVRLSNTSAATGADVLSEALAGGADLRFTNSTGQAALSYEIEHWSATSAAVWVRVPTVAASAETVLRMYWGNGAATSASSDTAVFGANNFLGVWHMGNTSGATPRPNAVKPGTNDATPAGPATAGLLPVAGAIGLADSMRSQGNGANGDHFSMGSITYPNEQVTMSMWMLMPTPASSGFTHFMAMGNNSTSHVLWMGRESAANWRAKGAGGTGGTNPGVTGETDNDGSTTVANGLLPQGTWNQLAVTRDSTKGRRWRMYKNGAMVANYFRGTGTSSAENRHNFGDVSRSTHFIGRPVGWNDPTTHMIVDETRISSIARSADWMKLEYETQKPGATALILGASGSNAARPLEYTLKSTAYIHAQAITPNNPIVNPVYGAASAFTVSPALPSGLSISSSTGVISGTPNGVLAPTTYVVSATVGDTIGRDTLTIRVNAGAPTNLAYPNTTLTYGVNAAITANIPTVNSLSNPNQLVDTFTVSPALPAGLVLNPDNGTITGTPTTAQSATNYTVSATNAAGTATQVLSIRVLAAPTALTYAQDPATYEGGLPIPGNMPTLTGIATSWAVQSGTLPAGLTLNTTTGAISGTPTAASTGSVTIRASNPAGFIDEAVSITVTAPEDYSTWSTVRTMQLNTAASGADVADSLTHFPVLVRLGAPHASIFAAAKGNGADVRFSLPNGTRLAYEIDRWDSASASADIWVLVPTVNGGGLTSVRMHYGSAAAVSKSNGNAVFSPANGYVAVWHLGGADGVVARPNSVIGGNGATPENFPTTGYVAPAGAIGIADTLRGGTRAAGDRLNLGTGYSNWGGKLTMSMWVKPEVHTIANWNQYISLSNGTDGTPGRDNIWMGRQGGNTNFTTEIFNGTAGGAHTHATNAQVSGVWQLLSWTVKNGNEVTLYRNGDSLTARVSGQPLKDTVRLANHIGRAPWDDPTLRGVVDEVRFANVARSTSWMKLEYKTQKSGVWPVLGLTYASASPSYVSGTAITANTVTALGPVSRYVAAGLPAGLTVDSATGALSGTPTAVGSFSVTVTGHADSVWIASTTLNITVTSPVAVPGAPTGVQATAGNAQATVTWVAPTSNGGAAITSYVVTAVQDPTKSCTWTTGPLTCTVLTLTNGTAYTFTVRAINSAGSSAASVASTPTTPTGINTGSFVLRVTNAERPYSFVIPAAAVAGTDLVTMTISDVYGRTVWSKSIRPNEKSREITWTGRNAKGVQAGAGMYIVRLAVVVGGKTVHYTDKAITLKP